MMKQYEHTETQKAHLHCTQIKGNEQIKYEISEQKGL